MRKLVLIFLFLSLIAFSLEEHMHEEHGKIELSEEHIKELGIKIETVKKDFTGRVIRIPGEVRENPLLSFKVYSPVKGIIKKLYVKEGDYVKRGEIIAEVYSPEIANLIGEIRMAKVRMKTARKRYERDKRLYEEGIIQYTRFFNSMIEYERAKGEYEALLERLRSYGEVRNYNLIIRSPGSGYVVEQKVVLGDSVGLDTLMFEIHSHEIMWVYGWADERTSFELKEGMKARVISSVGNNECRIDFIGHEVDEKTRRVKVRCIAKNKNHELKPGMFVRLEIRLGGKKDIVIPKSAVQEIEGKPTVFVWKGGHFEPRTVKIKKVLDGYYVVEGLKEGEKIAVSGTVFLKTKLVGVEEAGHVH